MKLHNESRVGHRVISLVALAMSLVAAADGARAQTIAVGGTTEDEPSADEIIVTASRRETTIRETPVAISAFNGDQLARENIVAFTDLVIQTPNVQLGSNDSNTNIAVRGIGTNLQTAGNDPGVAFHADGVYVADSALSRLAFHDVRRVEVLRGPQGTLFGRNATGGVVNVVSNTPMSEPSAGFRLAAGFPLGERFQIFANTPLNSAETLLSRVAFQQSRQRGRLRNLAPTGPHRFDDENDFAIRGQLEWRPTGNFKIRLQGDYQLSDTVGPAPYLVGSISGALPPQLAATNFGRPDGSDEVYLTHGDTRLSAQGVGVFVTWDVAGGALSAVMSRRTSHVRTDRDGDGTLFEFNGGRIDAPRKTTFAELLYTSDDDQPLSFVLGANIFHDDQFQEVQVPVYFSPVPITLIGDVDTKSHAFFGQAQYRLSPDWKIFGGVRYTHDRKHIDESNNFVGTLSQADSWSKVTFEAGTSVDLSPAVTAYLKYATGYKAGGYSSGSLAPAFRPETNRMWELGLKGSLLDRGLNANLALFHMSYNDLQVNQVLDLQSSVTNAARATIYGAELELDLRLAPELRLLFAGGWLHARFDEFVTVDSARPALGLLNLKGNRLPQAPRFTLGGGPVFEHEFSDRSRVELSARYDWKSRVYFSEFNLPVNSQKASGSLSANLHYVLPDGNWEFGLYGSNLTDRRTYNSQLVYASVLNSIIVGNLAPRREFGAHLQYRF